MFLYISRSNWHAAVITITVQQFISKLVPNQFFRKMQFLVIPGYCYCFIAVSIAQIILPWQGFVKDQTTDRRTALNFLLVRLKNESVCSLRFELLLCCRNCIRKANNAIHLRNTLFGFFNLRWIPPVERVLVLLSPVLFPFLSFCSAGCGSHHSKYTCIFNGRQDNPLNHDSVMKQSLQKYWCRGFL